MSDESELEKLEARVEGLTDRVTANDMKHARNNGMMKIIGGVAGVAFVVFQLWVLGIFVPARKFF